MGETINDPKIIDLDAMGTESEVKVRLGGMDHTVLNPSLDLLDSLQKVGDDDAPDDIESLRNFIRTVIPSLSEDQVGMMSIFQAKTVCERICEEIGKDPIDAAAAA